MGKGSQFDRTEFDRCYPRGSPRGKFHGELLARSYGRIVPKVRPKVFSRFDGAYQGRSGIRRGCASENRYLGAGNRTTRRSTGTRTGGSGILGKTPFYGNRPKYRLGGCADRELYPGPRRGDNFRGGSGGGDWFNDSSGLGHRYRSGYWRDWRSGLRGGEKERTR